MSRDYDDGWSRERNTPWPFGFGIYGSREAIPSTESGLGIETGTEPRQPPYERPTDQEPQ